MDIPLEKRNQRMIKEHNIPKTTKLDKESAKMMKFLTRRGKHSLHASQGKPRSRSTLLGFFHNNHVLPCWRFFFCTFFNNWNVTAGDVRAAGHVGSRWWSEEINRRRSLPEEKGNKATKLKYQKGVQSKASQKISKDITLSAPTVIDITSRDNENILRDRIIFKPIHMRDDAERIVWRYVINTVRRAHRLVK